MEIHREVLRAKVQNLDAVSRDHDISGSDIPVDDVSISASIRERSLANAGFRQPGPRAARHIPVEDALPDAQVQGRASA